MDGTPISVLNRAEPGKLDAMDSVWRMQSLIHHFHNEYTEAFPKALILAICWEASCFQNIAQFKGSAIGYGQLESAGLRIANQHLLGKLAAGEGAFTREAVLASRESSILALSHCLAGLYDRLNHNADAALEAYAGAANRTLVANWKACAKALQALPDEFDPLAFEAALQLARAFESSGPAYQAIHRRLWPLPHIVAQLKPGLKLGDKGPQVRLLQEFLSRQEAIQCAYGMFDEPTRQALCALQTQYDLPADGVLGVETLYALQHGEAVPA